MPGRCPSFFRASISPGTAAPPINPSVLATSIDRIGSSTFSTSRRAGTAAFASGPMSPNAVTASEQALVFQCLDENRHRSLGGRPHLAQCQDSGILAPAIVLVLDHCNPRAQR